MAEQNGATGTTVVAPTKRRPAPSVTSIEREFDDLPPRIAEFFRRPFAGAHAPTLLTGEAWTPAVDTYEADGALMIKAELPGVKQEDISITINDGYLTVAGERTEQKAVKDAKYYTAERFSSSFRCSFRLPDGVDPASVTAEYTNGVLHVKVPMPTSASAQPITVPITG